ncbi:oryzin precursor [Akanthomyces lecanii RCEF 1005]|uniref:Oryzin n=1 Tax=Akanthomyces lecanii RCEF 1005 TaxID=1081108 RepID=A0A162KLR7_CORDF|nr:oryzin precursor [Akanthomyces lecanii RCEF 1005]
MRLFNTLAAVLAATCASVLAGAAGVEKSGHAGTFIVVLKKGISTRSVDSHIESVHAMHMNSLGRRELSLPGIKDVFSIGNFQAYSGTFDDDTLQKIRELPEVDGAELEQKFTPGAVATQEAADHGLASMSSHGPGANNFIYDESAGKGTFAYVIDSGIQGAHPDFGGRVKQGFSATGSFDNLYNHGTRVAGCLGSTTYGVAKHAEIIDVRVFEHANGTTAENILRGFSWAVEDILNKSQAHKSVINISMVAEGLENADNDPVTRAVEAAFQKGILTVIGAGNKAYNVREVAPAAAPNAVTVGAIDRDWALWSSSGVGAGVDILAPGVDILTITSENNEPIRGSGTSFATPYVSGVALYLAALETFKSPQEWIDKIKALGTAGKVSGLRDDTVNLVAYDGVSA